MTLLHKKILFVEDDISLINGLSFALKKQGYEVSLARTCLEARALLEKDLSFDLVILDVALPDGNGYELCRELRKRSQVPLIFLTAADEETDMIMGLDLGGDDYITKPFKLAVLFSRINALLRRSENFHQTFGNVLVSGGIRLDLLQGEAFKGDESLSLTAGEYRLLRLFMEHPDQVLSPEQILERLWDCDGHFVNSSTLTVYIRRLRAKIEENPGQPERIVTVRRMGYKWNTREGGSL